MTVIVLFVLLAIFLYSLCAHIAYRIFCHADPPSKYSNQSPGTYTQGGVTYKCMSKREDHEFTLFWFSVFWPVSGLIWTLFVLPHVIVLRAERSLDKAENYESDTPYRGDVNGKSADGSTATGSSNDKH